MRSGTMLVLTAAMCGAAAVTAATVVSPGPARDASGLQADASDAYKVDPVHSVVLFHVTHDTVGQFFGRFNEVAGTFLLDPDQPEQSSLQFTVRTSSVDTHNSRRDDHLRSPDFFNARQFPTATFTSTQVRRVSDREWEVTGDLNLHGVTRPVTVSITDYHAAVSPRTNKQAAGFKATFLVNRSDFGITTMPVVISEQVRVIAGIEGVRD